ncbi:nucleophile aminohydrolase [Lipomyces oligophaga]|uniref:nucleophile aminohydrolase n=1 Tax=Lipomyces oligophaga TaxID=45792 RepID=UPI0034CD761A
MKTGVVAVHLGAGNHSRKKEAAYRRLAEKACNIAISKLKEGSTATEAAALAVKVLEESSLTNAGRGSNLTLDGRVECDAGVCSGTGRGAGIGALNGVRNPILVAEKLLSESFETLSLGRVSPLLLVGEGALQFAREQRLELATDEEMTTHESAVKFTKWSDMLADSIEPDSTEDTINDTVGAVCVDLHGQVASAASSGGVALKRRGRVGVAAIVGAGFWAGHDNAGNSVAVCTSGTGEDILSIGLARECGRELLRDLLDDSPDGKLDPIVMALSSCSASEAVQQQPLAAGALSVAVEASGVAQVQYAHTTHSMALAVHTTCWPAPHSLLSRASTTSRYKALQPSAAVVGAFHVS